MSPLQGSVFFLFNLGLKPEATEISSLRDSLLAVGSNVKKVITIIYRKYFVEEIH